LNKVKVVDFEFWVEVMVVPKKESWAANVVVAVRPGVRRMYVTHLGLMGVGEKVSKSGNVGG
jgi:hypothetical protein